MATSPAKENILKKIRQALSNPVPLPFPASEGVQPVFIPATQDVATTFAQEFTKIQGKFIFCSSPSILQEQLYLLIKEKHWARIYYKEDGIAFLMKDEISYNNLAECDVSITGCECLVARTGTIVMSSAQQSGRTTSVYAPIHICIAGTNQLLYDLEDAFVFLKDKFKNNTPSLITFASGPSRTADIEKTLVTGVHGPKEVYCFLVDGWQS